MVENLEASGTPWVIEWPNHAHADAVVYFTNGLPRYMDLGDGFPMTERFIEGLREIASMDTPIPEWKM